MQDFDIRRNASDFIGSNNKKQYINLDLTSTQSELLNTKVTSTTDLNILYQQEREQCTNYRVMLTINPYCSNVLFNPCTEITEITGNGKLSRVTNENTTSCTEANGKTTQLTPYDMVRNTEYSSEKYNYEYHPGLDIFNNHLLRSKSYRIVNQIKPNDANRKNFNTIDDYMRLNDGSRVKSCCRMNINDSNVRDKHLYDYESILSFEDGDAVEDNLKEVDGWFGFYNTTTIEAKKGDKIMDCGRVINNKGNCQFVDMYPDRTLFKFNPTYNTFRNRCEYNWDVLLTYPNGKITEGINLIQKGDCNGILVADCELVQNNGIDVVYIRSMIKHNLSKGDSVYLYINDNRPNEWKKRKVLVADVGDANGDNSDYYFSINDGDGIDHLYDTLQAGTTTRVLKRNLGTDGVPSSDIRFTKVDGDIECEYYVRTFKTIPGCDRQEFYKLAYADTIYGDDIAQITFTNTFDISSLKTNMGGDVTDIYATIVKRNQGYNEWYVKKEYDDETIEQSRCFGPITCGFEVFGTKYDSSWLIELRKSCNDVRLLTNEFSNGNVVKGGLDLTDDDSGNYYGDIVEYSPIKYTETVLSNAQYRFNTVQREMKSTFSYDEITSDDYEGVFNTEKKDCTVLKPEGYFYKPHYKLRLRDVGALQQDTNRALFISNAEPYVSTYMCIKITTGTRHNLIPGNTVVLTEMGGNNNVWELPILDTLDKYTAVIGTIPHNASNYVNWFQICDGLMNASYKLSAKNIDIPECAQKIGSNTYVWRNSNGFWVNNETLELPYANNAFYVDDTINFYLKRQNYDNSIIKMVPKITGGDVDIVEPDGLQNDVRDNYEYKEESEYKC